MSTAFTNPQQGAREEELSSAKMPPQFLQAIKADMAQSKVPLRLINGVESFLADLPLPTYYRYQNDDDDLVFVAKWGQSIEINIHLDGANLFVRGGYEMEFFPSTPEGLKEFYALYTRTSYLFGTPPI